MKKKHTKDSKELNMIKWALIWSLFVTKDQHIIWKKYYYNSVYLGPSLRQWEMVQTKRETTDWFYMGMLIPSNSHKVLLHECHTGKQGKGCIWDKKKSKPNPIGFPVGASSCGLSPGCTAAWYHAWLNKQSTPQITSQLRQNSCVINT